MNTPRTIRVTPAERPIQVSELLNYWTKRILEDRERKMALEFVEELLEARFDSTPPDLLNALRAITDLPRLKSLLTLAANARSLDEFLAALYP